MKTPSVFISDLTAIVATYLDMSTTMADREAEVATSSIRIFFCVDNMAHIGFFNSKDKSVTNIFPFQSSIRCFLL